MSKSSFDLRLSFFLVPVVFVAVMLFNEGQLLLVYTGAFLHELSHGLAALCFGIRPFGLQCTVFGLRLLIPPVTSSGKKLVIFLAGPLASFFIFGIFFAAGRLFGIADYEYRFFCYVNLFIGIINSLPVFPLDGAVILRTILSAHLGIIRARTVYGRLSVFFYIIILTINLLLISNGVINFSFVMILIFMLLGIKDEKAYSLMEKKSVLSGEIRSASRIRYIGCDSKSELLCLASFISYDYRLLVAAFKGERFLCELCQAEIIGGIKKYGALCTVEEYIKKRTDTEAFDIKGLL